ncbi:MAG: hypothetical protein BWZ07_02693 [Alphaproteobacteria bacterium ADurb.BinA280]|nr:MAG: hypothetical protein BWZ07_02693 [Alphaproteobacteria bacterium ADurb.BinA280]
MKGLPVGETCLVNPTGANKKPRLGEILQVFDKSYEMGFADGSKERISAIKVVPVRTRAKTAALEPMPEREESEAPVYREPVAQPKTQTRFVCDAYRRYVKSHHCVNCEFHGAAQHGNTEADHRGERGVSQKCSDLLVIPLCMFCHAVITAKNVLPVRPKGLSDPAKTPQLMSVVDTHLIVTGAQMKLLTGIVNALAQSDPDAAIKALEGGLRNLDKDTLAEACKMAMKEDE